MSGTRARDVAYIVLPLVLWPLSFDVFSRYFVYGMALSTLLLGSLSLAWFRDRLRWFRINAVVVIVLGLIMSGVLYMVFIGGYALLKYMGLAGYVVIVYEMVRGMVNAYALSIALVIIGFMEEVYWRGGLQELARGLGGIFNGEPWIASMIYYTLVHISTLNPALIAGAFAIGLVDGVLADKAGLTASIITHVVWLELMMVLLPLVS
ncbi:CPBP family glutamic-type intramembrane protease [Vulcanisaeta distributa]|uniref:Abortive infection protein n=1 Tax=Vulcanisaeta distributa (strain DSM 14429 / JCM 11212 / NBRC 100878 / IC-017) TaxID=572478 RepID=E1QRI3_VULDI|nr:CPBP family glutamic-type intramembrane protease [Vulcanisaeta distributa]ADN51797.1 Abortive infection protein [Vulcanisaeta distributa DSM 14429]